MRPLSLRRPLSGLTVLFVLTGLAGCAVAPPRTDDPYQNLNRKMYAFNKAADKIAIRPVAVAYTKVTNPTSRTLISNFFANIRSPITIINDLLQWHPDAALEATGRFAVNTTVGFLGFFDPASDMRLPRQETDFGVTLAQWGVPEGPFLVLPLIGPTTLRDVWHLPVDSYFSPLGWYARENDLKWHAQYLPNMFYLVTLRANVLNIDSIIDTAYDPYAFERDAYRQRRLYKIYYGNPPLSAIEALQGSTGNTPEDIDRLLEQQKEYEKTHGIDENQAAPLQLPAPASTAPAPAPASSVPSSVPASSVPSSVPAPSTSVPVPASSAPTPAPTSSSD